MISKCYKLGASLLAIAVLSAAAAQAASPLAFKPTVTGKLPRAGATIPTKLPRTTQKAVPVETAGDAAVLPGRAAVSRKAASAARASSDVDSKAYGYSPEKWPYTAARVASSSSSLTNSALDNPVTAAPYRQTGLLLMDFNGETYQCTAALILPNVLVTAAHCVQDFGMGASGSAQNILWVPANTGDPTDPAQRPFGVWAADKVVISDSYYNGTDTCARSAPGIVCNNDIALIALAPQNGKKAVDILGNAYLYGWNGYSYVKSPAFKNLNVADVTQLGYPVAFDDGLQMQRVNSFGKFIVTKNRATTTRKQLLNTQLGTPLTGGSSGGPWMVNFGTRPTLSSDADLANASLSNVVVGVTSYGYVDPGLNVEGSSFFGQNAEFPLSDYGGKGAGNIGALVQAICNAAPAACISE